MAQARTVSTVSETRINTFMAQVYLLMSVGMIVAFFFSALFNLTNINWALTFIGIALFAGLTAWDT